VVTRSTSSFKQLMAHPSARLVMGLGLSSVALFLGAVLGAIAVSDDGGVQDLYAGPTGTTMPEAGLGATPAPESGIEQAPAEEAPRGPWRGARHRRARTVRGHSWAGRGTEAPARRAGGIRWAAVARSDCGRSPAGCGEAPL
jgi:hypothetical protein